MIDSTDGPTCHDLNYNDLNAVVVGIANELSELNSTMDRVAESLSIIAGKLSEGIQ